MKKRLILPIAVYPYIDIAIIVLFFASSKFIPSDGFGVWLAVVGIITALLNVLTVIAALCVFRRIINGHCTAFEAVRFCRFVKLVHIPAYVLHFLLGTVSLLMSVWGIPFLFAAVVSDLLSILLSGSLSCAAVIRLKKESIISRPEMLVFALGSFIYIADVFIAVCIMQICKKRRFG